jgi:hypothetical protein
MTVSLDPRIKELFLSWGDYAVVPEIGSDGEGAVLFKAPLADIRAWRGLPLLWQWQVGLYPTGALLRLHLAVVEPCEASGDFLCSVDFEAEVFLNPGGSADREIIDALLEQDTIAVHFFDAQMRHRRSTRYRSHQEQVSQLMKLIQAADEHLAALDASQLDFSRTKSRMMADCPMALSAGEERSTR